MAKPIRATPTLYGKDAIRFIKTMIEEEKNPSKNRLRTLQSAKKNNKYLNQFI